MSNYYAENLNSQNLFRVYDTEIPRVRQFLQSEIDFVKNRLTGKESVLEVAAGYGRIMRHLAPHCGSIMGIDISEKSVELGKEYLSEFPNADMVAMNAHNLTFDCTFDVILCLQNGLSAMRADSAVIKNILALLSPGGTAYFSSYSENFWEWRLKWFEEQAEKNLLGEIDYANTGNGIIMCKDGFRAITHSAEDFRKIGESSGYPYQIREIDESSLFLLITRT